MTIETWSAGLSMAGIDGNDSWRNLHYDPLWGNIGFGTKPKGDGWHITGYRTVAKRVHPKYGSIQTQEVPIWSRELTPTVSAPAPQEHKPDTTPTPINLNTNTNENQDISSNIESQKTPIQDFKLAEQAAEQRSYIDNALKNRMEKFQNLLNSLII